MTTTETPAAREKLSSADLDSPKTTADLLSVIQSLRARIGDGLNDTEFTALISAVIPPATDGFRVVCFCEGHITFAVPRQREDRWYSPGIWIAAEKEELAKAAARDFGLSLCEPPDKLSYIYPPPGAHHHLELISEHETVAVAHPLFLKLRIVTCEKTRTTWKARQPLPCPVELFKALAPLYC